MGHTRVLLLGLIVLLAGCPLPYDYSGEGSGTSLGNDPSTPNISAPVIISYSVQGGESGSLPQDGSFSSNQSITVTLATETENSTIYYIDDGSLLTSLTSAKTFGESSGDFVIPVSAAVDLREIYAVAVGPGMLPSPPVHGTVTVNPFPVISISQTGSPVSEDGGNGAFVITASEAPDSPLTLNLLTSTSGTYEAGDITSFVPSVAGTSFTFDFPAGATSRIIDVVGVADADFEDETVVLVVEAGAGYGVAPSPSDTATITITDNDIKPKLAMNHEMVGGFAEDYADWLYLYMEEGTPSGTDLTVTIQTAGNYEPGDLQGWGYSSAPLFPFPDPGGTFTLTIPAGNNGVSWEIHPQPDADLDDETIIITIVDDPSKYQLGTVPSLTLTILEPAFP